MSGSISRRAAVGALACAAANVPAVAVADAAPRHADHELLKLGGRYQEALQAEAIAIAAYEACSDACAAADPERPAVLRHRMDDHWEHGFPALEGTKWIRADEQRSDYYYGAEVDYLRTMTHRTDEARARAEEIIAAWEGYVTGCEAVEAALGYEAAQAGYSAAVAARKAIGDAIVACRAMTLQGLAVRARIVADMFGDDDNDEEHLTTDQKMMFAIVRDLARMEA